MNDTTRTEDPRRLPPASRGMRAASLIVVFLLGAFATWFVVGNPLGLEVLGGAAQHAVGATTGGGTATTTVYRCPMHPQVVQDHPGDCPLCGMPLEPVVEPAAAAVAETLYRCPMHPQVVQDHPGDCPLCGMPLEPVAGAGGGGDGLVTIDPAQVQTIGVVTALARRADIARTSRTVGVLDFNADRVAWVTTKVSGWIEAVHTEYVGETVRRGQPLFEIYSPELVASQEEYLRTLGYVEAMRETGRPAVARQAESLLAAAHERLRSFDVTDAQIERLAGTREVARRLVVESPADGVVAEVMQDALGGMRVQPGMNLYRIADLGSVWLHAEVYERDLAWVRPGLTARVSFPGGGIEPRSGTVLFLDPEVSAKTRTLKVCVELDNRGGRLRPGMYAEVTIDGPTIADAIVVPDSAVIRGGDRDVVFVALGEGRFEPRTVSLGVAGPDDEIQVTDGVAAGEEVVIQAQFLLDSESRMREAIAKFRTGRP